MIDVCPSCKRKLISHASARCNWCGYEIIDSKYQAQAEAERQALYAERAMHDAQSLARYDNIMNPIIDPWGMNAAGQIGQQIEVARQMRANAQFQRTMNNLRANPAPQFGQAQSANGTSEKAEESAQESSAEGDRFRHLEL
jgi:hypothetical protein